MRKGLDAAQDVSYVLLAARERGCSFAGRYLWPGGKGLTPREARAVSAVFGSTGLALIYEGGARSVLGGTAAGARAAEEAVRLAKVLGVVGHPTIYGVAVDFDAGEDDLAPIGEFAAAYKAGMGDYADAGSYGNGLVGATLLGAGHVARHMLWGAPATNGTRAFDEANRWAIRQHPTVRLGGISEDPDDAVDDFGGCCVPVLMQLGDRGDDIRLMQRAIGATDDGAFGPATEAALNVWLAAHSLPANGVVDDAVWAVMSKG